MKNDASEEQENTLIQIMGTRLALMGIKPDDEVVQTEVSFFLNMINVEVKVKFAE